jgi:hypothetical protein
MATLNRDRVWDLGTRRRSQCRDHSAFPLPSQMANQRRSLSALKQVEPPRACATSLWPKSAQEGKRRLRRSHRTRGWSLTINEISTSSQKQGPDGGGQVAKSTNFRDLAPESTFSVTFPFLAIANWHDIMALANQRDLTQDRRGAIDATPSKLDMPVTEPHAHTHAWRSAVVARESR